MALIIIKEQIARIRWHLASFGKGSRLGHFTDNAVAEGPCKARLRPRHCLPPDPTFSQPSSIQHFALMLQLTSVLL